MAVPIAHPFAHGVGAVEQLDEAHAPFQQPPGQDAIPGKAGLVRIRRVVGPIGFERGGRFARQIAHFRRAQLQPGGQFIAGDPRGQFRVGAVAIEMLLIQHFQKFAARLFAVGRNARGRQQIGDRLLRH